MEYGTGELARFLTGLLIIGKRDLSLTDFPRSNYSYAKI